MLNSGFYKVKQFEKSITFSQNHNKTLFSVWYTSPVKSENSSRFLGRFFLST